MKKPDIDIFDLTPAEKLELVEDLWDDLAADPDAVPVQPWVRKELRRRKAAHEKDPSGDCTFAEVKRRIRARHGR